MTKDATTDKIGTILTGTEKRDAIHIAVAPVQAAEDLLPGQHVGLLADGRVGTKAKTHSIGIVDPYLTKPVKQGQSCWLFLYPKTITNLRHEWRHHAFDDTTESEKWLRAYAIKMNSYDTEEEAFARLIDGLKHKTLFAYGSDLHGLYELDDAGDLRYHAEAYLGIRIDWEDFTFSCSC